MRVLLVLVLTFFVGCNANTFQPMSRMNVLIRRTEDMVSAGIRTVDRSLNHIMTKTEPGIFWSAQLKECLNQVGQYIYSAWEQVPPEAQDQISEATRRTLSMIRRVEHEMKNVKREIEPIFEEAALVAERIAVELTDEVEQVKNIASPYVVSLELCVQEYLDILKSYVTQQQ